jgi:uncharacterized membrane protein YeaQ/YmgE (transglycosylase-associated protein family)
VDALAWIVIGLLAGALSGLVVPGTTARGCLPYILVGILGAIVGGFIFRELRLGDPSGFFGALLVAFVGAVVVRMLVGLANGRRP